MVARKEMKSPLTRINKLLKQAGHQFMLVRGRGYHYYRPIKNAKPDDYTDQKMSSLYCCWLDRTEKDFQFVLHHTNEEFKRLGIPPLTTRKEK